MKIRLTLVFVLVFAVFLSNAQEGFKPIESSVELKSEFKTSTKSLSAIQSDFVQEKYLSYLSTTVVSKGKFWYKKPDKLRWEYTEPFKFMVIMNGDKVLVKDENQTNAYKNKPNQTFQMLNQVLANSVTGNLIDNSEYEFEVAENSTDYRITLKPVNPESRKVIEKIEMLFGKKNLTVYQIIMFEPTGDTIKIRFENKRVNTAISNQIFEATE